MSGERKSSQLLLSVTTILRRKSKFKKFKTTDSLNANGENTFLVLNLPDWRTKMAEKVMPTEGDLKYKTESEPG